MPSELYQGSFYPCYRTPEGMRESSHDLIFTSESPEESYEEFIRYALTQFKNNNIYRPNEQWLYIGCIKMHRFAPPRIKEDGYIAQGYGDLSFRYGLEWKCDAGLYQPSSPSKKLQGLIEELGALRIDAYKTKKATLEEVTSVDSVLSSAAHEQKTLMAEKLEASGLKETDPTETVIKTRPIQKPNWTNLSPWIPER